VDKAAKAAALPVRARVVLRGPAAMRRASNPAKAARVAAIRSKPNRRLAQGDLRRHRMLEGQRKRPNPAVGRRMPFRPARKQARRQRLLKRAQPPRPHVITQEQARSNSISNSSRLLNQVAVADFGAGNIRFDLNKDAPLGRGYFTNSTADIA
jgi:hypothetical protein